jgi:hypothetical protein
MVVVARITASAARKPVMVMQISSFFPWRQGYTARLKLW